LLPAGAKSPGGIRTRRKGAAFSWRTSKSGDLDEYQALAAFKAMRLRWGNPKAEPDDFCAVFEKNKLLLTAQRLKERIELI